MFRRDLHLLRRAMSGDVRGLIAFLATSAVGALAAVLAFLAAGRSFDPTDRGLWVALFALATLISWASWYVAQLIAVRLSVDATHRLRSDVLRRVLDLPVRSLQERGAGELADRIDDDVSTLADQLGKPARTIVQAALTGAIATVALTISVWQMAVVAVVSAIAMALFLRKPLARFLLLNAAKEEAYSETSGVMEEAITARRDLRANLGQGMVARQFALRAAEVLRIDQTASRAGRMCYAGGHGVAWLNGLLLTAVGVYLVMAGEISFGQAVGAVGAAGFLFEQLRKVSDEVSQLQNGLAALKRVGQLLAEPTEAEIDGDHMSTESGIDWSTPVSLSLSNVTFSYPDADRSVLRDVSLHVEPGTSLGLVGRTGAGKTTVVKLISRIEEAPLGTVFIGGVDVRTISHRELRSHLGYLSQRTDLLDATLFENVSLFDPAISEADVLNAMSALGLNDWMTGLSEGIDTRLGSGGRRLSAGETQLIAFARLWVRRPSVVVLDEATSRLDPATERLVREASAHLLAGRTAVIIAHRMVTLDVVHSIAVLDAGAVVESGSRIELAERADGRYAQLVQAAKGEDSEVLRQWEFTETDEGVSTSPNDLPGGSLDELIDDAPANTVSASHAFVSMLRHRPKLFATAGCLFFATAVLQMVGVRLGASALSASETSDASTAWSALLAAFVVFSVSLVIFASAIWRIIHGWNSTVLATYAALVDGQTEPDDERVGNQNASPIEAAARAYDCNKLIEALDNSIDAVMIIPLLIVAGFIVVSPVLLPPLVFVLALPLGLALAASPRIGRLVREGSDKRARMGRLLGSIAGGAATLKLFGAERGAADAVLKLDLARIDAQRRQASFNTHIDQLSWLPVNAVRIAAVAFVWQGWIGTAAGFVLFQASYQLGWHAWMGKQVVMSVASGKAWLARYQPLLAKDARVGQQPASVPEAWLAITKRPTPLVTPYLFDELSVEHASVVVHDGATVLNDVSLCIKSGQMVVVTGRIGSGKSTLLNVLAGLTPLDRGVVKLDGTVIQNRSAVLRPPNVSWVPQLPSLVSGTIEENVSLDHDVDLAAAITAAQLDEDLTRLDGLDTPIGNKGVRLSGGQMQRVALARALAHTSRLVVCDDVSSALDVRTEQAVWEALLEAGLMVVAASTRLVALSMADWVIVLDEGRVADEGRWTDLAARWSSLAA